MDEAMRVGDEETATPRNGPRNGPRTRAGEANEERILDAALDAFASRGYHGARIDAIAAAAGLSKPNLLYYFKTKDALYLAVLRRTLELWLEPLRELDEARDPRAALEAYVARKLAYSRDLPSASKLFALEIPAGRAPAGARSRRPAEGARRREDRDPARLDRRRAPRPRSIRTRSSSRSGRRRSITPTSPRRSRP